MHVRSLVSLVGLSLVSLSSATTSQQSSNLIICEHLPTKWSYVGCFSDSTSARALSSDSYHDDTGMSEEKCIEYCDQRGYPVAGVEYSRECFCGYELGPSGIRQSEDDCNMVCTGNSEEKCGGPARLNVFTNGDKPPSTNPGANGYNSLGCYSDSPSSRTLTTQINSIDGSSMSVAACTSACKSAGFTYAGVEFGSECYCGNQIEIDGAPAQDGCNKICTGNRNEWCGGAGRINIYQSTITPAQPGQIPTGWSSKGCYTDNVSARTLGVSISMPANKVTVESCLQACGQLSYTYAGVEWGQECYCGNSIDNGGAPAASGCNMACKGNTGEICGGSQRLNLYQFSNGANSCDHPLDIPNCFADYGQRDLVSPICGQQGACYCFPKANGSGGFCTSIHVCGKQCNDDPDCEDGTVCIDTCCGKTCTPGNGQDTQCANTASPRRLFARMKREKVYNAAMNTWFDSTGVSSS